MDSFDCGHSWICFRFVDGRTEGSNAEGRRKAIGWIKTRPEIRRYPDHLLLALLKARRPEKFKDRATVEHDTAMRRGEADKRERRLYPLNKGCQARAKTQPQTKEQRWPQGL